MRIDTGSILLNTEFLLMLTQKCKISGSIPFLLKVVLYSCWSYKVLYSCFYTLQFAVFTDVLKTTNHLGFVILIGNSIFGHIISELCLVYTAEMTANHISSNSERKFCLCLDCMSVLRRIKIFIVPSISFSKFRDVILPQNASFRIFSKLFENFHSISNPFYNSRYYQEASFFF